MSRVTLQTILDAVCDARSAVFELDDAITRLRDMCDTDKYTDLLQDLRDDIDAALGGYGLPMTLEDVKSRLTGIIHWDAGPAK